MIPPLLISAILASGLGAQSPGSRPSELPEPGKPGEPARAPSPGRVRDLAGGPWTGANILCVSQLFPEHPSIPAFEDRVETTSDRRGRFRVDLLEGRIYSVYAWSKQGAGRVSGVLANLSAGSSISLKETKPPLPPKVRILGLEEWRKVHGPLHFRVAVFLPPRLLLPIELEEDGIARLPPLPPEETRLEILDRNRNPLFSRSLALLVPPKGSLPTIRLPAFEDLRILALTDKEKKAVPDVRILHVVSRVRFPEDSSGRSPFHLIREVGRTDSKGRCTVRIPWLTGPHKFTNQDFLVVAKGFAIGQGKTFSFLFSPGYRFRRPAKGREAELKVFLQPSVELSTRVIDEQGEPIAKRTFHILCKGSFRMQNNSYSGIELPWIPIRSDEEGRIRFTAPSMDSELALLLPPAENSRTPLRIRYLDFPKKAGGTIRLGDSTLEPLRRIRIRISGPEGLPVRGAKILVSRREGKGSSKVWKLPFPRAFVSDRKGVARLTLPSGSFDLIAWKKGKGYRILQEGLGDAVEAMDLSLEAFKRFTGRCLGPDGKPLAGVRIRITGWGMSGNPDYSKKAIEIDQGLLEGKSGEDGGFELFWIPIRGTHFRLRFEPPSKTKGRPVDFRIDQDSILDQEIRL